MKHSNRRQLFMESDIKKMDVEIPDFLQNQDDKVVQHYVEWVKLGRELDNHPDRFQTIVIKKTGETRTLDLKSFPSVIKVKMKEYGMTDEEQERINAMISKLMSMKNRKSMLNVKWTKAVFGRSVKKERIGYDAETGVIAVKQAEILDLFGRNNSVDEVARLVREKWQLSISTNKVREFYNMNKEKIDVRRAEYALRSKEFRLATDTGRLEVLSKIAYEMELRFDKDKNMDASKELRAVIEQIRKEVKGEEIKLTIDGKIDINATIQANKTINDVLQKLPINLIVIGLTAAKQNINPLKLMAMLSTSYYSRFNGYSELQDKKDIELPGRFIRSYNWEDLKTLNDKMIASGENVPQAVEEADAEVIESVETKKSLIEILNQVKGELGDME